MRRWALVGGVVALAFLATAVGLGVLFSNAGCAQVTLRRADDAQASPTPPPPPVKLDEARVRSEAPRLAELLDRAVEEGEATEPRERSARAMWDYLKGQGASGGGTVEWRGVALRTELLVC